MYRQILQNRPDGTGSPPQSELAHYLQKPVVRRLRFRAPRPCSGPDPGDNDATAQN
jgi:hypothetical protein